MYQIMNIRYMKIYTDGHHYIIHNTKKEFKTGHTHINNFNTAKYIATLAIHCKLPNNNHISPYLIKSLIRISTDKNYINELDKLMEIKKTKRFQ